MAVSSFTSLSRENVLRLVNSTDFFTRNPELQPLQDQVQHCKDAYIKSKKSSSCGCGGNTKLLIPCFEALLARLDELKQTKPEAIETFVQYVTGQPTGHKKIHVSIYYTKNNGAAPHRYEYVA